MNYSMSLEVRIELWYDHVGAEGNLFCFARIDFENTNMSIVF